MSIIELNLTTRLVYRTFNPRADLNTHIRPNSCSVKPPALELNMSDYLCNYAEVKSRFVTLSSTFWNRIVKQLYLFDTNEKAAM
jgi:hypothetical protein